MLQKMRDHSQSTATKILLGVLIIVFTMFGFGAFEAFIQTDPPAANVNGTNITRRSWRWKRSGRSSKSWRRWARRPIPISSTKHDSKTSVLDSLINQTVLDGLGEEDGAACFGSGSRSSHHAEPAVHVRQQVRSRPLYAIARERRPHSDHVQNRAD